MAGASKRSVDQINKLVNEVERGMNSPRNQDKKNPPNPSFVVAMENIGWAQLFDYHMQEFYDDPYLNLEMQLEQKLFHLKNYDDDTYIDENISASTGYYWDFSFFGLKISHQKEGVPKLPEDHPLRERMDLKLLPAQIDFYHSGEMPQVHFLYQRLKELVEDKVKVVFPRWERGPLDTSVQLRGYDNFIMDTYQQPEFAHSLMEHIANKRIEWWGQYLDFIRKEGESDIPFFIGGKRAKIESAGIADDWVNIPFISPEIFKEFVFPHYLKLADFHKNIIWFHSCGDMVPLQKYLLKLPGLEFFENSPWMKLEKTLENIPPDKHICARIRGNDILLHDEGWIKKELGRIVSLCQGRKFTIVAEAFQKLHDDYQQDIRKIKEYIKIAKEVLGR